MACVAHPALLALVVAACAPGAAGSRANLAPAEDALRLEDTDVATGLLGETAATEHAAASGMEALVASLLEREDAEASSAGEHLLNCQWPQELKGRYTDQYQVGTGATACVYLAKDQHGKMVAVKLAKSGGKLKKWTSECSAMQRLHLDACKAKTDGQALKLMETYIPTCLEVGGTKNDPYYVMQAAGTQRIGHVGSSKLSSADRISVFAQLVAAVYALHSSGKGWSHNDLHGGNAVLDGARVALIDFGSLRTLGDAKQAGSKRDGNRLWEHTATIFKCGPDATWDRKAAKDKQRTMAKKLKECLKQSWGADGAFLAALDTVLEADIESEADQHIKELYETSFVQKHLPATDDHFKWLNADTCKPTQGSLAGKV